MKLHIKKIIAFALSVLLMFTSIDIGWMLTTYAAELESFNVSLELLMDNTVTNNCVWNSSKAETKQVRLRLSYTNNETTKGYDVGELGFILPGLGGADRTSVMEASDVAANKNGNSDAYIWDYFYDNLTDTYTFTNHQEISPEVRFSGSFEILYSFHSRNLQNAFQSDISALFFVGDKSVYTNEVHFEFYSDKDAYTLVNSPSILSSADGLGQNANDYYWVKYTLNVSRQMKARDTKNEYFLMTLPEGAFVRDIKSGDFQKVDVNENVYRISYVNASYKQHAVVGFPKDDFSLGESVNNHVELRGYYLDTNEDTLLTEANCTFSLSGFDFDYSGSLYGIQKTLNYSTKDIQKSSLYKNRVVSFSISGTVRNPFTMVTAQTSGSRMRSEILFGTTYSDGYLDTLPLNRIDFEEDAFKELINIAKENKAVRPGRPRLPVASASNAATSSLGIATYSNALLEIATSNTQDIYIGDDFLDITVQDDNGRLYYRTLEDDEYEINSIYIPGTTSLYNANGYDIEAGKYTANIILGRDLDASPFTSLTIGKTGRTVQLPSGTTAVWIHIPGVDESLYFSNITVNVQLHLNAESSISDEGYIRNFTGLMVKKDGILLNPASRESYVGDLSEFVADRDWDTYAGPHIDEEEAIVTSNFPDNNTIIHSEHYVQRDYASAPYVQDSIYHAVTINSSKFEVEGSGYTSNISYTSRFEDGDAVTSWSVYSLLPPGLGINSEKLDDELLAGFVVSLKDAEGIGITKNQIINSLDLDIVYNYQNTGRNLVKASIDLSNQNINVAEGYLTFKVPIIVSRDAYETYGGSYVVFAEQMIDDVGVDSSAMRYYSENGYDDGKGVNDDAWYDINQNGDETEALVYNYSYVSIIKAMATHMELEKSVWTEYTQNTFKTNRDSIGNDQNVYAKIGSEYKYRLRFINSNEPIKNVLITDILETGRTEASESSQWKGTLKEVDISYLTGKGYNPIIYYSDSDNPGSLDSGRWSLVKSAAVKSVAVLIEQEVDSGEYLYVDIIMEAPSDGSLADKHTINDFSISYQALNTEEKLDSNTTKVKLASDLGDITIIKKDGTSGLKLSGAVFDLYEGNSVTGTPVRAGLTTNVLGKITIRNLKFGTYTLKETKAPVGYEEITAKVEVGLGETQIELNDPRKTGSIYVTKKDNQDKTVSLEGAKFDLYTSTDRLVRTNLKTDASGILTIDGLEWDSYYLIETEAPYGYNINEEKYSFTIQADKLSIELVIYDDQKMTTARLRKCDAEDGTYLKDAFYDLYVQKGSTYEKIQASLKTDATGEIIVTDLPFGKYEFREVQPPKGYLLNDEPVGFIADETTGDTIIDVSHEDERKLGTVLLTKTSEDGMPLEGAIYSLFDKDNNRIATDLSTDADGRLSVPDLEWKEYYFKEIEAPKGYQRSDEAIAFEVHASNVDATIRVDAFNNRIKGSVELIKVSEADSLIKLSGAVFSLYSSNGTKLAEGLTTNSEGKILIQDLDWDSYYFQETKAPDGYGINPNKIRFSVNSGNSDIIQKVVVEDPVQQVQIKINKQIDGWYEPFGTPTFLFKIEGTDITGQSHIWYESITLYGNAEGFTILSGLPAGRYTVTEEGVSRYGLTEIIPVSQAVINGQKANIDLTDRLTGEVTFKNATSNHDKATHKANAINIVTAHKKLTGISVTYKGPEVIESETEAEYTFKAEDLDVIAYYDDGTSLLIPFEELTLSPATVTGNHNDNNAGFTVQVSFIENGIKKYDSFSVKISLQIPNPIRRILYNANGGYFDGDTSKIVNELEYKYNRISGINELQDGQYQEPEHLTLTFDGWYLDEACIPGMEYVFDEFVELDEDIVVYAKWKAFTATFQIGTVVSARMKQLAGKTSATYTSEDTNITAFKKASILPESMTLTDNHIVSTANSEVPIYMWFESETRTIYWWSKAGEVYLNATSSYMFYQCKNLMNIEGLNNVITSNVTNMHYMFRNCLSLQNLVDLRTWDVSKVTDMMAMFYDCRSLQDLESLRTWDVSLVRYMNYMFYNCSSLQNLQGLQNWNVKNVIYMHSMFTGCMLLQNLEGLKTWNVENVTDMSDMFGYCSSLQNLDNLGTWDVGNVTDMSFMFSTCDSLQNIDGLENWDVSNVTDMFGMFTDCYLVDNLYSLRLWDVSNVFYMTAMFEGCDSLENLNGLENWDVSSVVDMLAMFSDCSSLQVVKNLKNWNVSNVIDMGYMFEYCLTLQELDLSGWDTSRVISMYSMFSSTNITNISYGANFVNTSIDELNSSSSANGTYHMFYRSTTAKPPWTGGTWNSSGTFIKD